MTTLASDSQAPHTAVWEDFWLTIRTYKWLILLVFLATVVGAYGALQLITERYDVQARVLVKLGRENIEVPATVGKGGVFSNGVRPEEINSEIQMLTARDIVEKVVDKIGYKNFMFKPTPPKTFFASIKYHIKQTARWVKAQWHAGLVSLNLAKELSDRDKVILSFQKALKVEPVKSSDVIEVTLRLPDPDLAVRSVDTLLQLYLDRHVEVRRNGPIREFFDHQVADYKKRLTQIEREKETLRNRDRISSVDVQRRLVLDRLHKLYSEIGDTRQEMALLHESAAGMTADMDGAPAPTASADAKAKAAPGVPERIEPDADLVPIKKRIAALRIERVSLYRRYEPGAVPIQRIDQEIASLTATLYRGLTDKLQQLNDRTEKLEQQLKLLNTGEAKLDLMEQESVLARQNYLEYAKRREEARVSEELDVRRVSNIAILSPPSRPLEPVYPRKLLIMAVSLPIGLLLGIGLALLVEYLNDRIRTPRDLARIDGVPFLGSFRLPAGGVR